MKDNFIVIIPSRENSKRLPSKNIRLLCGKLLISYTIEYAIKFFEKKIISNSPYPYIIDGFESIIDIDYDFILAELLLKNQLIKV